MKIKFFLDLLDVQKELKRCTILGLFTGSSKKKLKIFFPPFSRNISAKNFVVQPVDNFFQVKITGFGAVMEVAQEFSEEKTFLNKWYSQKNFFATKIIFSGLLQRLLKEFSHRKQIFGPWE
jgi:hypothetical protein